MNQTTSNNLGPRLSKHADQRSQSNAGCLFALGTVGCIAAAIVLGINAASSAITIGLPIAAFIALLGGTFFFGTRRFVALHTNGLCIHPTKTVITWSQVSTHRSETTRRIGDAGRGTDTTAVILQTSTGDQVRLDNRFKRYPQLKSGIDTALSGRPAASTSTQQPSADKGQRTTPASMDSAQALQTVHKIMRWRSTKEWIAGIAFVVGGLVLLFTLANDAIGNIFTISISLFGGLVAFDAFRNSPSRNPAFLCLRDSAHAVIRINHEVLQVTSGRGTNRLTTQSGQIRLTTADGSAFHIVVAPQKLQPLLTAIAALAPNAELVSGCFD